MRAFRGGTGLVLLFDSADDPVLEHGGDLECNLSDYPSQKAVVHVRKISGCPETWNIRLILERADFQKVLLWRRPNTTKSGWIFMLQKNLEEMERVEHAAVLTDWT